MLVYRVASIWTIERLIVESSLRDMYASRDTEMASVTVQSSDVISSYSESILVPLLQWCEARTSLHGAMREVGEMR